MRDYLLKLSVILFSASIFVIAPLFGVYLYYSNPQYSYAIIPWMIFIFSESIPLLYILLKLLYKKEISIIKTKYIVRNTILITITGNIILLKFFHNPLMIVIQVIYIVALFLIYSDIKAIEKIMNNRQ